MAGTPVNPPEPARDYHRVTNYAAPRHFGDREDPRVVRGYRPMDPARVPPEFKQYPGGDQRSVPEDLSPVLFLSNGAVRYRDHPQMGRRFFRAAGSAGNLHPLEVYVLHGGLLAHYDPVAHRLTELAEADTDRTMLVVTGIPWRTGWKYTERGLRHLYWDCGTMLAQLLALAPDARVWMGFVDEEVRRLVGADGVHEHPLALVTFDDQPPRTDVALSQPPPDGYLADDPLEFPLVTAAQRAGDLPDDDAVARWRRTPQPSAAGPPPVDDVEGVIRRRGSTRRFKTGVPAPAELLDHGMALAAAPVPADFVAAGGSLLTHHVAVHAVDGRRSGTYRWTGDRLELLREGDVRAQTAHACVDQDLGGDGAFTVFHGTDLDDVTSQLGSRGYRAAQLEAGIAEGRLHLAAFSRAFGATGLTFFDDAVRDLFATDAWPMLCTAVGSPATRAPRAGIPGHPVPVR